MSALFTVSSFFLSKKGGGPHSELRPDSQRILRDWLPQRGICAMDLGGSRGLVVAFHDAEWNWSNHMLTRFNKNVVRYF